MLHDAKTLGAYFTPEVVADALVRWAVRSPDDLLLDPSSGDGRFVARHPKSVGVERDPASVAEAAARAPDATIVQGDFFAWASDDRRRFDCAAGNPPFIRYQRFSGATRQAALDYCRRRGVMFSGLSSSWAPFIVVAASKLRAGGRIAFVVPAEIGHAPYATPLVEYLVANFGSVHVVAIREKIFPRLAEDCWLLFADDAGRHADGIRLSRLDRFARGAMPPAVSEVIPVDEWRVRWRGRLRPFLLAPRVRDLYARTTADPGSVRLGGIAQIGVGYVSGANRFFHLRPSDARRFAIPDEFLLPSIRNSRYLTRQVILIASKVVSRKSLRRLTCKVDLLYSISMTKERFFFSLSLTKDQKFEIRKKVVLQFLEGKSVAQIKSCVPCSIRTIYRWISRFYLGGLESLRDRKKTGRPRQGTDRHLAWIRIVVLDQDPHQDPCEFAWWTAQRVRQAFGEKFSSVLSVSTVRRILRRLGLPPQRPQRRATRYDPAAVQRWQDAEFPQILRRAQE